MAEQLQVLCSTAGWVEACRSIAGLHPSCSLRLRPHPKRGLARLQSGLQPHRPGVLCSGLRPAAAAAGCSRDCCTTLLLRLHCAAAAAALCCMRGFTALHCSTGKFWVTAASVRLRSAWKALQPPRGRHSSSASTFGERHRLLLVVWVEDLALSGNNICPSSFSSILLF